MKYVKIILTFTILACILLTFCILRKEKANEEKIDTNQQQKQEEIKEEPSAITNTEYSSHRPASYIESFKVYKTIDTSKDSTEYAKNAMLEYLAGELNITVKEYLEKFKDFKPDERVYGFEINLNNYGQNEVIGVREFGCATITCTGDIIQKQNGKWVDLGYIEFSTEIEILQNKTNGYHDIRSTSSRLYPGVMGDPYPEIKRFKNGEYGYTIYAKEILDAKNKL